MTRLTAITRRAALRSMAAVLFLRRFPISMTYPPAGGDIEALFTSMPSAAHVGTAFLALRPDERDRALLEELTAAELAAHDGEAWRAWFSDRRRAELGNEEVVEIDGWVLSLCEARICALIVVRSDATVL